VPNVTVFRHQSERLMRAMLPGVSLTLLVASCSISASSEPPESDADRTPGAVSGSNRGPGLEGQVIRLPTVAAHWKLSKVLWRRSPRSA
jgi:hypothetical protein